MFSMPPALLVICFVVMMGFGAYLTVWSLIRLAKTSSEPAQVNLPGLKLEVKGPSWLIVTLAGVVMIASPVLVAALQKPQNTTIPPPPDSVKAVQDIAEPDYSAFRFSHDVSLLDLRASTIAPWYSYLPGVQYLMKKPKIRPTILKNYMLVRKLSSVDKIHITYGTSGALDLRCITHHADYRRSERVEDGKVIERWEAIVDVSSMPINEEFEIIIEATYWNAFSGSAGDDYTTYSHNQTEPEEVSTVLLFPDDKPFKNVACFEYVGDSTTGNPCQGRFREWPGAGNRTYYRTTTNTRGAVYYKLAWTW